MYFRKLFLNCELKRKEFKILLTILKVFLKKPVFEFNFISKTDDRWFKNLSYIKKEFLNNVIFEEYLFNAFYFFKKSKHKEDLNNFKITLPRFFENAKILKQKVRTKETNHEKISNFESFMKNNNANKNLITFVTFLQINLSKFRSQKFSFLMNKQKVFCISRQAHKEFTKKKKTTRNFNCSSEQNLNMLTSLPKLRKYTFGDAFGNSPKHYKKKIHIINPLIGTKPFLKFSKTTKNIRKNSIRNSNSKNSKLIFKKIDGFKRSFKGYNKVPDIKKSFINTSRSPQKEIFNISQIIKNCKSFKIIKQNFFKNRNQKSFLVKNKKKKINFN